MNDTSTTKRLELLRQEYQEGEKIMQDLTRKLSEIEPTLLRISGAIQVLEELLKPAADSAASEPEQQH